MSEQKIIERLTEELELALSQKPKWISVKDETPEIGEVVIVMEGFKDGDEKKYKPYVIPEDISGAMYWHDKKFYVDHPTKDFPCTLDDVTHWMPKPPPPVTKE